MKYACSFALFLSTFFCFSQTPKKNTSTIFLEAFGNSDWYSISYEHLLKQKHGIRLGISLVPGTNQILSKNDRYFWYFPAEYSYLIGKKNHKLNLSVGIQTLLTYYTEFPNHFRFRPQLGIGYRYQKEKGLFMRLGVINHIPLFLSADVNETFFYTGKHWLLWPQGAVGWSF